MNYFQLPLAGYRDGADTSSFFQESYGMYWSSSPSSASSDAARLLLISSSDVDANRNLYRAYGDSVRCFKDSYVAPTTYSLTFDSQNGSEVATRYAAQ